MRGHKAITKQYLQVKKIADHVHFSRTPTNQTKANQTQYNNSNQSCPVSQQDKHAVPWAADRRRYREAPREWKIYPPLHSRLAQSFPSARTRGRASNQSDHRHVARSPQAAPASEATTTTTAPQNHYKHTTCPALRHRYFPPTNNKTREKIRTDSSSIPNKNPMGQKSQLADAHFDHLLLPANPCYRRYMLIYCTLRYCFCDQHRILICNFREPFIFIINTNSNYVLDSS